MHKRLTALCLSLILIFSFIIPASAQTKTNHVNSRQTISAKGIRPDLSGLYEKKAHLSKGAKKLSTDLLQLTDDDFLPEEKTRNRLMREMQSSGKLQNRKSGSITETQSVYIYIHLKKGTDPDVLKPYAYKITNTDQKNGIVVAWVDVNRLEAITALDCVTNIQTVVKPVVNTGSVLSQGYSLLEANLANSTFGLNGTGIKIGVISDGVNHYERAAETGDIPSDLTVLSDAVGGDEGTAMLEIVHDIAPEAKLYFHDCGNDEVAFTEAIDDLANAGCNIICDDIGWITQPFFEDGSIAQHIETMLAKKNIIYVTSAGNQADTHFQGLYCDDGGFEDFSNGESDYKDLYAKIPSGSSLSVVLQWNDAFGASSNDYDLYLANMDTGKVLATSMNTQSGSGNPLEAFDYTNSTGSNITAAIVVKNKAAAAKTLEVYIYPDGNTEMYGDNLTVADSIYGHAAAADVITCGAVRASAPEGIEFFSSQGPVTMLSGTRQKPDICGIDGVSVTGAGGFTNPFYGTSAAAPHVAAAAAPHVAAAAALLMQRFPSKSVSQIRTLLLNNSVDLGDSGYDNSFGYGRCDIYQAAKSACYVSFESNGGTEIGKQLVQNGNTCAKPEDPKKAGYTFSGWFKDAEFKTAWDFAGAVADDITLFAKWIPIPYQVSFQPNNGSSITELTINYGDKITGTPAPEKTGYTLDGWYKNEGLTEPWDFDTDTVTADITLYARWLKTYTVRFDASGGSAVADETIVTGKTAVKPEDPEKAGYTLDGWYKNEGLTEPWDFDTDTVTADITLYARWLKTYTVRFDASGGSAVADETIVTGKTAVQPKDPKKTGYTFGGWFSDKNLTKAWNFATGTVEGNTTLYAKWYLNVDLAVMGNGTVTGGGNYAVNTPVTLKATPGDGNRFVRWIKNNATVSAGAAYSFVLSAPCVLTAEFKAIATPVPVASSASYNSINLSWKAVEGAAGYSVSRAEPGGTYKKIYTGTACAYTDKNLVTGRKYSYSVQAYCVCPTKTTYSAQSTGSATPKPAMPEKLKLTKKTSRSLGVSWSKVLGAVKYEVYRATSKNGAFSMIAAVAAPSYTNKNLARGKTYYYKVKAYHIENGKKVYGDFSKPVGLKL